MTFNNLQDLFEKQEKLKYEKNLYVKALKKSICEQKKCIKKRNKEYWNSVIENYREIVINYEDEIKNIDMIYNNALIFPKEIFIPFILECINIFEDEKYISRNLVLSLTSHLTTLDSVPTYGNFQIFFPERIIKEETKLENSFYISVMQYAYKELFEKTNVKNIMLATEGYITLLSDNLTLLTYYKDFPYLESVGINLIERRLREPDKKISDILTDEIDDLKEKKKNKNLCK